jgi:ferredoxin
VECIDCGVREPECSVDPIKPDTEPGLEKWLELNAQYAKARLNITKNVNRSQCEGMGGKAQQD